MRQIVRRGLRQVIVEDVPDPVVRPHQVVIRTEASLISSGTETASIHVHGLAAEVAQNPSHVKKVWNVMKTMGPMATLAEVRARLSDYAVLGYSGAGTVAVKHPTVADLEVGDRVAYGGEGTGHAESILAGRNLVARVPDDLSIDHACFATLGSIAMNAVRIARIGLGDTVAVIGLGLVGQLIAQLARLQGGRVVAVDLRQERIDLARALGAEHGVLADPGLHDSVQALTGGRGVDCAIVAAASRSSDPATQAVALCRDRGRIVVVGAVGLSFPWQEMYRKELQIFMSRAYGPGSYDPQYERGGLDYPLAYVRWTENRNMEEFLRLLAGGQVQAEPLITHRFPLERAPDAYATLLDPAARSLAVVLRYPESPVPQKPPAPARRIVVRSAPLPGTLRVAAVGAGNLARWVHLPLLGKLDGVALTAICSASGARGKSYARRFGATYCCADYTEILDDPDIDVVLITSRNQDHAAQALAALGAGKHVFVEKPMALAEDECRELVQTVTKTGRHLTVGFNRRFAPDYVALKRHLTRRTGPAVISARVNSPAIAGEYWMADPAIGGAILGEACHFVDLFHWLLEAEPVAVSAYSLPLVAREPIGINNMAAAFRFADGSVANLTYCTVGSPTSAGERVEAFAPGIAVASENFKSLTVSGRARTRHARWFAAKGYREQMESFVRSIRDGVPPAVSVLDGARATLGCLGMIESARRRQPVEIDLGGLSS